MNTLILYSILIAVFAVSYRLILAYEPALSWWFKFGLRFHKRWYYAPIWGCELCFAGQLALWTYCLNWFLVILEQSSPFRAFLLLIIPNYHQASFSVLNGLIFIAGTILMTNIVSHYFQKLIKNDNI